jgi:hypothetical protein
VKLCTRTKYDRLIENWKLGEKCQLPTLKQCLGIRLEKIDKTRWYLNGDGFLMTSERGTGSPVTGRCWRHVVVAFIAIIVVISTSCVQLFTGTGTLLSASYYTKVFQIQSTYDKRGGTSEGRKHVNKGQRVKPSVKFRTDATWRGISSELFYCSLKSHVCT